MTSDDWNDHMLSIGVIPILDASEIERSRRPPWIVPVDHGVAVPGRKLDVEIGDVADEVAALTSAEMRAVEDAWIDLLELRALLMRPPILPPAGPGGAYPHWARIYYGGARIKGEQKFYVACSPDQVNAWAPAITVVRLTSSPRGFEFPEVARGTHACAGNITTFPLMQIDQRTPTPVRTIPIEQMQRIAAAVAITHALEDALGVTTRELESLLT